MNDISSTEIDLDFAPNRLLLTCQRLTELFSASSLYNIYPKFTTHPGLGLILWVTNFRQSPLEFEYCFSLGSSTMRRTRWRKIVSLGWQVCDIDQDVIDCFPCALKSLKACIGIIANLSSVDPDGVFYACFNRKNWLESTDFFNLINNLFMHAFLERIRPKLWLALWWLGLFP